MAGYLIYSLDWEKFQRVLHDPTREQLRAFARILSNAIDPEDEEFREETPLPQWPSDLDAQLALVKERLARPEWYGDLSELQKSLWSEAVADFCCNERSRQVGFRAEHVLVYWDAVDLARKYLNIGLEKVSPDVAFSAFGKRPYRYRFSIDTDRGHERNDDTTDDFDFYDLRPTHSMHSPAEVQQMLGELRSVGPAIERAGNKHAIRDYYALAAVFEQLVEERRMLFVQVDT